MIMMQVLQQSTQLLESTKARADSVCRQCEEAFSDALGRRLEAALLKQQVERNVERETGTERSELTCIGMER